MEEDLDDFTLPVSEQPCKECKRRRAKCDRSMPECSTCVRSKRHCLYERHSRTPLTRKHLTSVEAKLERAEALLRSYRKVLKSAPSTIPSVQYVTGPDEALSLFGVVTGSNDDTEVMPAELLGGVASTVEDPADGIGASQYTLESLDWDERHRRMVFGDARSWREHHLDDSARPPEDDVDADERLLDGMAMLSVDGRDVGYIGVASGAAFLKHLWQPPARADSKDDTQSSASNSKQAPPTIPPRRPLEDYSLPSDPGLRRVFADTFINAYFSTFHPVLPIIHEESFRAVWTGRRRTPSNGAFNALANIVAAVGAFSAMTQCMSIDTPFYYAAKAALSVDTLESGCLTLVQAFALMSYYLQKRNKPNSGYTYAGLAMRVALGLGLNREFPAWKISPLATEIRRRVFWGVFVVDASICMTLSRPIGSAQDCTDTPFPLNIEDGALLEGSQKAPPSTAAMTKYSGLRAQAEFFLAASHIYKSLIKTPYPSLEELVALDKTHLDPWFYLLAPAFRVDAALSDTNVSSAETAYALTRLITTTRQRHLRIIMYRPFLVPFLQKVAACRDTLGSGSAQSQGYARCVQAAHDTIRRTASFWQSQARTRLAAWYVLYFTFQAALIPAVCLRNAPRTAGAVATGGGGSEAAAAVQAWREDLRAALDSVEDIHFIHASKCASVLHELVDPYMFDDGGAAAGEGKSDGHNGDVNGGANGYVNGLSDSMNLDADFKEPNLLLEVQDFSMQFPTNGLFDLGSDLEWPVMWPDNWDHDTKFES